MKNSTLLMQGIMTSLLLASCGQAPTASAPATSTPTADAAQAPPSSTTMAPPPQPMTPTEPSSAQTQQASSPRPAPRRHAPAREPRNPPADNDYRNPPPVAYGPPPPPAYPPQNHYPPPDRYPPPPDYSERPSGGPPDAGIDANFFRQALAGGELEVRLSKLGVSHSQNPQIRRLAQMMISDHGDLNAELSAVSRISRVPIGDEVVVVQLAGMSGAQFDQRYLADMIENHRNAIALFQDAARNARSQATRGLAANALPRLQGHLGALQRARQEIGQSYPGR